jgi:hypothetical protein
LARNITPEVANDIRNSYSPSAILGFITISHENLPKPIRIVSDPIDFEFGGELWVGCPFEFSLLNDNDSAPTTQIRVQNVDRRIGEAIRSISERAQVALEARSTSEFNLSVVPRVPLGVLAPPIYSFRHFDLIDVTVNSMEITGTIILRDYTQESYPGKRATQTRCPGLFR